MGASGHFLGLAFCALGIYVSYIPYGIFQESIYSFVSSDGKAFNFTLTLLSFQVLAHTLVSGLFTVLLRERASTLPMKDAWMPGATFVLAMLCSNMALEYVSYPTQALAKSSKMIPVMLGGLFFGSERYSILQYLQVLLVTIGILVFQWKAPKTSRENDVVGLVLLLLSLLLDGLTGPKQKLISKKTQCTSFQLMFACNFWALVFVLAGLFSPFGEHMEGFAFVFRPDNAELFRHVALFSACSAVGSIFIFFTLRNFGFVAMAHSASVSNCAHYLLKKFFTASFYVATIPPPPPPLLVLCSPLLITGP
jgi:UDP-galactose transporter B1